MHDCYSCNVPPDGGDEEEVMDKGAATEAGRDAAEKVRDAVGSSEIAQKAKDAAYTLVGLGVMGAQRATAATKQAVGLLGSDDKSKTIKIDVDGIRFKTKDMAELARRQLSVADELVEGALSRIEEAFSPIEEWLPASARETVVKVRGAGRAASSPARTATTLRQTKPLARTDRDPSGIRSRRATSRRLRPRRPRRATSRRA
jgi:hypothetical protein